MELVQRVRDCFETDEERAAYDRLVSTMTIVKCAYAAPELLVAKRAEALWPLLREHYPDHVGVREAWNAAMMDMHRRYHLNRRGEDHELAAAEALPWLSKGWTLWVRACPPTATIVRSDGTLTTGRVLRVGHRTIRIEVDDGWIEKGVGFAITTRRSDIGDA